MIYMLEVNVLVALIGFSLAGLVILWRMEAKKYAHALVAMQRLTVATRRESFVDRNTTIQESAKLLLPKSS
jgi:hypothetical protein